jgi:hypothetical protein
LLRNPHRKPLTIDQNDAAKLSRRCSASIAGSPAFFFGADAEESGAQERVFDQAEDRRIQPDPTASPARTVSVITARSLNPGDFLNCRSAKRRSVIIWSGGLSVQDAAKLRCAKWGGWIQLTDAASFCFCLSTFPLPEKAPSSNIQAPEKLQ